MVPSILKLRNHVMEYDWGSKSFLQELLSDPRPVPMAELWMGAHPKAPSIVEAGGESTSLDVLIQKEPAAMLGTAGGELPFLFKVLASVAPLSIQCHPDKTQAAAGFARENKAGIAFGAPNRSYKDPNAKPELICALTSFYALHGFRPFGETVSLWQSYGLDEVMKAEDLGGQPALLTWLLELDFTTIAKLYDRLTATLNERYPLKKTEEDPARKLPEKDTVDFWLIRLLEMYPTDAGAFMPLLLQLHALSPGEALFSEAGQLHSYLEGTGLEIMGNSDNVLRAGLTGKHKDPAELMKILKFDQAPVHALTATRTSGGSLSEYPLPADSFVFGFAEIEKELRLSGKGPVILLNIATPLTLKSDDIELSLNRGESVYLRPGCKIDIFNGEPDVTRLYFASAADVIEHH